MKQFCCTLHPSLPLLTSYARNFADFFKIKHYEWITISPETPTVRRSIWTNSQLPSWAGLTICPNFPQGEETANYRERCCHRTMYL